MENSVSVLETAKYPKIIEKILDNLEPLAPDLTRDTLLGMLLSRFSYALCCMRVQFRETEESRVNYPNLFTAFYLHSNMGKDSTTRLIKSTLFPKIDEFLNLNEKDYLENKELFLREEIRKENPELEEEKINQKAKDLMKKERKFNINSNSAGTPEGLYAEMAGRKKRRTGAVYIEQSEAGVFADSSSERKQDFLNCLYCGYDNRLEGRNLKDESFPTIEDVPMVAEFLSSPDIIKSSRNFKMRQVTGLGRRIWIFMQEGYQKKLRVITKDVKDKCIKSLKELGTLLDETYFKRVKEANTNPTRPSKTVYNTVLPFEDDIYDNYYIPYENEIIERSNKIDEESIRLSLSEHPFRACKVACIYAILNHPNDLMVRANDFLQAKATVEATDCIGTLMGYEPNELDKYDYLVEALVKDFETKNEQEIIYKKEELNKMVEKSLKGRMAHSRVIAREMLNLENYTETKAILKERLQKKSYDLLEEFGKTSFKGLKLVKLSLPNTTAKETTNETDLLYA